MIILPLPNSIRYIWNVGSILGGLIAVQILTGLLLRIHYISSTDLSFGIINSIITDLKGGSILRFIHCNGSRIIFICLYIHIFKGIFYKRFNTNVLTWLSGSIIYVLLILISFLGYVLPWGQIRYWGATVISSLITTLPVLGNWLLVIVWGDYRVRSSTLNRFYTLHFIIPFLVLVIMLVHLYFLHNKGSSTLLNSNKTMLPFSGYYVWKDILGLLLIVFLISFLVFFSPYSLLDSENRILANSLVTPIHIVPEWYFLFAYCILKRVESKRLGVILLLMSVLVVPFIITVKISNNNFIYKFFIILWSVNFVLLTYMGSIELLYPFQTLSILRSIIHFIIYLVLATGIV